jgi:hypothetical protein
MLIWRVLLFVDLSLRGETELPHHVTKALIAAVYSGALERIVGE